jgi:hypothetical protein
MWNFGTTDVYRLSSIQRLIAQMPGIKGRDPMKHFVQPEKTSEKFGGFHSVE